MLNKITCWKIIHWVIIINFLLEIIYATYMVFVAYHNPGTPFILFGGAGKMPFEKMVARRLYAIEDWIAMCGLSIYLAITEIMPTKSKEVEK